MENPDCLTHLRLLFRTAPGFIRFQRERLAVGHLLNGPELRSEDLPTSATHVAINLDWREARTKEAEQTEQPRRRRQEPRTADRVGFLCALYADVKTGRGLHDWLPEPSISITAGDRTVFLWLLKNSNGLPLKLADEPDGTRRLYNQALKKLNRSLARTAEAEPEQTDLLGCVPLPGPDTPWFPCADPPRLYLLAELLDALGVARPKRRGRIEQLPSLAAEKARRARQRARLEMLRARQARLLKLAQMRSRSHYRWDDSTAREAVRLAACFAKNEGVTDRAVSRRCGEINRLTGCPFGLASLKGEVRGVVATWLEDQTISDRLGISPDEAEAVGWPPASRFQEYTSPHAERPPSDRLLAQEERRRQLADDLKIRGYRPSINEAQEILAELGFAVSRATAKRDLESVLGMF